MTKCWLEFETKTTSYPGERCWAEKEKNCFFKSSFFFPPKVTLLCFPDRGSCLQPTEFMICMDVLLDMETQLKCFP